MLYKKDYASLVAYVLGKNAGLNEIWFDYAITTCMKFYIAYLDIPKYFLR